MTKKVVIVVTNAHLLGDDHPTGLWIEECASPYYRFKEAGFDVVIASPDGGPSPVDAGSMAEAYFTEASRRFMHDADAIGALSHTVPLSSVDLSPSAAPTPVDALFFCGGHGTCVDFVSHPDVKSAVEAMYSSGRIVAAVCHGPNCLPQCTKEADDGGTRRPLVEGLRVAAFTDEEEDVVGLSDKVPFLLERRLREQGCEFEKADPWTSKVCVDGNLVTGQNPQSSEECADAVVKLLLSST